MDYQILKTELTTDPLTRGYAGMTNEEVATDMNTLYRTRNRDFITGDEAFQATDNIEFVALADLQKQLWVSFSSKDTIDPFATSNVDFVTWIFGGGSTTVSNLQTLRIEPISRAFELLESSVTTGDIQVARQ